jgi:hypothetical protein
MLTVDRCPGETMWNPVEGQLPWPWPLPCCEGRWKWVWDDVGRCNQVTVC